jgi:hypothetical protein
LKGLVRMPTIENLQDAMPQFVRLEGEDIVGIGDQIYELIALTSDRCGGEASRDRRGRVEVVWTLRPAAGTGRAKTLHAKGAPQRGPSRIKQSATGKALRRLPYNAIGTFVAELRNRGGGSAAALEFAIAWTGEVIGARGSEIDAKTEVWTIPPDRMKARVEHGGPFERPGGGKR